MKVVQPQREHTALRDDLVAVLRKHADPLSVPEMLAVAAHLVGQLVALQNQRTMSPNRAMEIVAANIEQGNQEVIAGLFEFKGHGMKPQQVAPMGAETPNPNPSEGETLAKLIARVEQASGHPGEDAYLNRQVGIALDWSERKVTRLGLNGRTPGRWRWFDPAGKGPRELPRFTGPRKRNETLDLLRRALAASKGVE